MGNSCINKAGATAPAFYPSSTSEISRQRIKYAINGHPSTKALRGEKLVPLRLQLIIDIPLGDASILGHLFHRLFFRQMGIDRHML